MTLSSTIEKCQQVKTYIDNYQITKAISTLSEIALGLNKYEITDRLNRLRETYDYMSRYLMLGVPDATREDVFIGIVKDLNVIIDLLVREQRAEESSDAYSSTLRVVRLRSSSLEDVLAELASVDASISLAVTAGGDCMSLNAKRDSLLKDLFEIIWVSFDDKQVVETIRKYMEQEDAPGYIANISYIVSALVLSLMAYYDSAKLSLLIDLYDSTESETLAARAMVGVVLALRLHSERVVADRSVMDRLGQWKDSLNTFKMLKETMVAIIRTRDTDRITTKMRDEVIPELMKMKPDILRKMKDSGMDMENSMYEMNAEWEEMLEKSGIGKKMRELSEMQSEGADLMMVTFSNLKQFPFFYNVNSWFLPFDINHPVIKLDDRLKKVVNELVSSGVAICDSDKYSLALALGMMPEGQRNMVISQFEAQISQMSDEMKDSMLRQSLPEFEFEVTRYVRDLYRFNRLYRKHGDFYDPFASPFNFLDIPVIGEILSDNEILKVTGEFYFKRGYYKEALDLFKLLSDEDKREPSYWEKTGYCNQCLKDYEAALADYKKAELLHSPGMWLIKKLALINKRLGKFDEAAEYYDLALERDPDSVNLLVASADMKFEMAEYKDSLIRYYHASYIAPDDMRILRSIAWTEMMDRQFEKSASTYKKLLAGNPTAADYMNAAHLNLVLNDIPLAIDLYKMSGINNRNEFERNFLSDIPVLTSLGVDELDLHLLLDALKMELSI